MSSASAAAPPALDARARFPWVPILILGFAWFLGVAIELSPAGMLIDIARDLKVSIAAAGTLTTFYALGNAVLVLPLTAWAIRFARRPTLLVVMAALTISNVIVAVAPALPVADAGRFLGGASYALICSLFPAVVVGIAGPGNAVKGMTVVFTATSLGAAFGAPLSSFVGDSAGWRLTFLGMALLVLIGGLLLAFAIPPVQGDRHDTLTLRETARLPGVVTVAIGWSLVMMAHFVALTYIDAYLDHLGAPARFTGLALIIVGVASIAGTLLIGQVSSRSLPAALLVSPVLVAAGFLVVLAAGDNLAAGIIGLALWGTGLSAAVVVYQQAILLTGARAPESSTSIGVLLVQVGFAAGATVGGISLNAFGIGAIPLVALILAAGSIAIAIFLRPVVTRAQQAATSQAGDLTNA